jgi:beta-aspartyl-peptidase (threonine type)
MGERADWALILHGGARTIAPEDVDAHRAGCLAAVSCGADLLRQGASAEAAVEAVIRVLEDDPTFNAGCGAVANADGVRQLDAAMMRGRDLAIGAVGALEGVRNPISVARALLDETAGLLVGGGARAFAERMGAPQARATAPAAAAAAAGGDTVGCIALDSLGAVALSGDGDSIARVLLAARVMTGLQTLSPKAAARAALDQLARVGGEAGAIVLNPLGQFGCVHTSEHFAVAFAAAGQPPRAILHQDELDPSHD